MKSKSNKLKETNLIKYLQIFVPILISLFALIIAFESWRTSLNTYEYQNRPWLIMNIVKNENTKSYYDLAIIKGDLVLTVIVEIVNKGSSPAINVKVPNIINCGYTNNMNVNKITTPSQIVLGQNEKYYYFFPIHGKLVSSNNINAYYALEEHKNKLEGIKARFIVTYEGLSIKGKEYRTIVNYYIEKKQGFSFRWFNH